MSVSGAGAYTWQPGNITSPSFTTVAQSSIFYTIYAQNFGCYSNSIMPLVVQQKPVVQISGWTNVCEGTALILNSTSQFSYAWSGPMGFSAQTQSISIQNASLGNAGIYTLSATNASLCSTSSTIQVNIIAAPNISIAGPTLICSGNAVAFTVNGSASFNWLNFNNYTSQLIVNPQQPTTYTCIGTANGCSSQATIAVAIDKCLDVLPLNKFSKINSYPNPCSTHLIVELPSGDNTLKVFDATGRLLISQQSNGQTTLLNTNDFAPGYYLLEIIAANQSAYIKFAKQDNR